MEIIKTSKGSVSVLGGKTDMGKSTIACFDCAEKLRSGKNVMFMSYEYCQSIIYNKLVTHFGLKFQELFKLDVIDCNNWGFEMVKSAIRVAKDNLDVVYIDYLDLLAKSTDYEYTSMTIAQKMELKQKILADLADIASELKIEIIVLTRIHSGLDLNMTIEYINQLTAGIHSPAPVIKMFIGKDEALNPIIHGNDMSHVIIVEGSGLTHFSSINLKQAYKN